VEDRAPPPYTWGVVLAVPPALSVAADADLWWHWAAGRWILASGDVPRTDPWSYTAPGAGWIDHEWAFEVAFSAVHAVLGDAGALLGRALVLALGVTAWLAVIARRVPSPIAWLLVAPAWPLLALLCNLRPQTLTWMLVPVAILATDALRGGRRGAAPALAALVLVWVNLHGGFLFGWGIAGLALLLDLARRRRIASGVALLVVALAPFANPYGAELVAYTARELTTHHPDLPEWNPPSAGMAVVACLAALPPWLGLARVRPRGLDPLPWVGLAVACVATVGAAKFVALILVLSPICTADVLAAVGPRLRARSDAPALARLIRGPAAWAALAFALALHVPFTRGPIGVIRVDPSLYPAEATRWLAGADAGGRLLVPLGWGGMALARDPRWQVSLDGRNTTVYPPALVQTHTQAWISGDLGVLLAGEPHAALVPSGGAVDRALASRAGWRPVWRDATAAVWLAPGVARTSTPARSASVFP
jgi:hypothetical protein